MPLLFTPIPQPGCFGSDGLMVATSNSGLAFGSIILGGGGGSGIVQADCGIARGEFHGRALHREPRRGEDSARIVPLRPMLICAVESIESAFQGTDVSIECRRSRSHKRAAGLHEATQH